MEQYIVPALFVLFAILVFVSYLVYKRIVSERNYITDKFESFIKENVWPDEFRRYEEPVLYRVDGSSVDIKAAYRRKFYYTGSHELIFLTPIHYRGNTVSDSILLGTTPGANQDFNITFISSSIKEKEAEENAIHEELAVEQHKAVMLHDAWARVLFSPAIAGIKQFVNLADSLKGEYVWMSMSNSDIVDAYTRFYGTSDIHRAPLKQADFAIDGLKGFMTQEALEDISMLFNSCIWSFKNTSLFEAILSAPSRQEAWLQKSNYSEFTSDYSYPFEFTDEELSAISAFPKALRKVCFALSEDYGAYFASRKLQAVGADRHRSKDDDTGYSIYTDYRGMLSGYSGEYLLSECFKLLGKTHPDWIFLQDITLDIKDLDVISSQSNKRSTAEIDGVVISPKGIFVIEAKNYSKITDEETLQISAQCQFNTNCVKQILNLSGYKSIKAICSIMNDDCLLPDIIRDVPIVRYNRLCGEIEDAFKEFTSIDIDAPEACAAIRSRSADSRTYTHLIYCTDGVPGDIQKSIISGAVMDGLVRSVKPFLHMIWLLEDKWNETLNDGSPDYKIMSMHYDAWGSGWYADSDYPYVDDERYLDCASRLPE